MTKKDNKSVGSKDRSEKISVSISFEKSEVDLKERGPYTSVIIEKGIPLGSPGQPALPWRKFYVSIPLGAVPKDLAIEGLKTTLLAEGVTVEPCQPNVPTILGTKVDWVSPDPILYDSEKIWPEVFARFTTVRHMGKFAMAELEICPFRYHPRSKKLELIEQLDLSLSFTRTELKAEQPSSIMALKYEQKFIEKVKKMVLNPEDVSLYRHIREVEDLADLKAYPQIDYVVVTSDPLVSTFQRLADWRTLLGLQSRVVAVEDIIAGTVPDTGGTTFWHTSGYHDGGTRDVAEAIRNFTKWASVNWLTDYVLLGGDTEIIPCRHAIHSAVGNIRYRNINRPDTYHQLAHAASASTEETGALAGNVLDENVNTVWKCASNDTDPWVQVSIGHHQPANCVELTWGNNYASSYTIEVSQDGTTWTDVYTASSGSGGIEKLEFPCISAAYVRLRITSGTNFSLAEIKVYGPWSGWYGGAAYQMNGTLTRIYLCHWMAPNPTNSFDDDLILIKEGPRVGTVIPYNESSNDTTLGWHFVEDLVQVPGTVKTTSTWFIEIRGPPEYHGNTFVIKDDFNYIPTDLYYADIQASEYPSSTNHDWDADRNGVYGERYSGELDSVNGIADIYVGRAPVETPEEAEIFVDKIICYEKSVDKDKHQLPRDFAVSILLGSQNWGGNVPNYLDGSAVGKENIRRSLLSFDSSRWVFTRRYEDYKDVPAPDQTPDLKEASKQEILDAIKEGHNVVSLSSHGSSGYLCYLVTDDIDDVISYPAIFYGNACSTNRFDVTPGEAFSEWTILNKNGAGVAYVGNSRYGWTGDNPMELAFWEEMLDSGRLGEMFNTCKLVILGWQSYSLNLLGDPAMRVWSDRPKQLNVTHRKEMCTGHQTVRVTVTSEGNPVENALVCMTMKGTLFVTGETDPNGVASLSVAPKVAGTMRVTVSGKNLIPYLGSIIVRKCEDVCLTSVVCKADIACGSNVVCLPKVLCVTDIICKTDVVCKTLVACKADIACVGAIACGARVTCLPNIMCKASVFCGPNVTCKSNVVCGADVTCKAGIICMHALGCTRSIDCKEIISCHKAIMCAEKIHHCLTLGICGKSVEPCPRLRPDELKAFEHVYEIWGIQDMSEFVNQTDTPDVKKMMERLPPEIRKPIRMMVERIRDEEHRE